MLFCFYKEPAFPLKKKPVEERLSGEDPDDCLQPAETLITGDSGSTFNPFKKPVQFSTTHN